MSSDLNFDEMDRDARLFRAGDLVVAAAEDTLTKLKHLPGNTYHNDEWKIKFKSRK